MNNERGTINLALVKKCYPVGNIGSCGEIKKTKLAKKTADIDDKRFDRLHQLNFKISELQEELYWCEEERDRIIREMNTEKLLQSNAVASVLSDDEYNRLRLIPGVEIMTTACAKTIAASYMHSDKKGVYILNTDTFHVSPDDSERTDKKILAKKGIILVRDALAFSAEPGDLYIRFAKSDIIFEIYKGRLHIMGAIDGMLTTARRVTSLTKEVGV